MTKTILCADDSVTMQTVAEITFDATEFQYVGARSADEALQKARANKPALILADAVMPGKTGYDLCREIKADPRLADVPVVVMCGNSQAYDAARGAQVGADGHVTKPWDTQQLLDRLNELLQKVEGSGVAKPGQAGAAASAPAPAPAAARPVAAAAPPPAAAPAAARPAQPFPAAATPGPSRTPAPTPAPAPARASTPAGPPVVSRPAAPPARPEATGPRAVSNSAANSAANSAPRSATLMGMPSVEMPPGKDKPSGVTPIPTSAREKSPTPAAATPHTVSRAARPTPGPQPAAAAPVTPAPVPAAAPAPSVAAAPPRPSAPMPMAAPASSPAMSTPMPMAAPAPVPVPPPQMAAAAPAQVRSAAAGSAVGTRPATGPGAGVSGVGDQTAAGVQRPPMIRGIPTRKPPYEPRPIAVPRNAIELARAAGIDPTGPEMTALMKISHEVVERIVWEVVPELAETIIRENLDKFNNKH